MNRHRPLIAAIAVLWTVLTVLLILSMTRNQGHLLYALDDPYIHMAMAKNVSQQGVWGVTPYGFTSSSSSPLWTALLSLLYAIFGVNDITPFLINWIAATIILVVVSLLLTRFGHRPAPTFVLLMAVLFLTPLPSLVFCGLEHTLHVLLTIVFVSLSARTISEEQTTDVKLFPLLITAPLVTTVRYEGFFVVFVVCILFLLRKRYLHAMYVGAVALLPLILYGLVSVSQGWHFLPNPVFLKAHKPGISSFEDAGRILLIPVGLTILILLYRRYRRFWEEDKLMMVIFLGTVIVHAQVAHFGWFYRYAAYLVALFIVTCAIGLREYLPERLSLKSLVHLFFTHRVTGVIIIILIVVLLPRGFHSLTRTPQATTNIYEQQYQMGLFLKEYYQGNAIAANDVGAINYLAEIDCLDLLGLANMKVAERLLTGTYDRQQLYELAKERNIKVTVLYDHWFTGYGGLPSQWVKVAQWGIRNNIVCGGDTVSFYAVDQSEKDHLIARLRTFSSKLPKAVFVIGAVSK